jgi:CheY-like chemotaxis protein
MEPLQHVLYVDDEPDMRMLVQITLENVGSIKVSLCENALDVLETAIEQKPQMIILDAMMPDMDGPAILQIIKKDARIADIPVVFLTAKTAPAEIEEFIAMGAVGVLKKPFDLTALPGDVRALWEKHHG